MIVLGSSEDLCRISHPPLHALVSLRLQQLSPFAPTNGLLIVVEVGDSVEELEKTCGMPILHDPFEDVPFGHSDFTPNFEFLEAHHDCYEMHFDDSSDDGIGITLFIPREEGIPGGLLALCAQYATTLDAE